MIVDEARVRVAAAELDINLRIKFVDCRARVTCLTHNKTAIDAVNAILGHQHQPHVTRAGLVLWRMQDEANLLKLLRVTAPFMEERKALAEALIGFLEASDAKGMWEGMTLTQAEARRLVGG